jgi:PAS domain S-box-containing protein
MKILLVEDDANARECMAVLLEQRGYAVERACNGAEGLEKVRLAPPDLIISDVMMPEMDGFLMCRRIKEDGRLKHIPVILYTGTVVEKDEEALARRMGAARFMGKPAEISELVAAVKAELEKNAAATSAPVPAPAVWGEGPMREYLGIFSRKLQRKEAEIREARKSLAESDERYLALLDSALEPMIIHRDGIFLYLNPAALRILRAERQEQLVGRSLLEVVVPENRDFVTRRIRETGMGGQAAPLMELKLLRLDGAAVEVEFMGLPTVYQGKSARHVIVRDMSEINRAAVALRASEEKYRKIFENIVDVFYQVDANGKISEVSPSATRCYGYTRDELIGMPMSMLYADVSDREKFLKKLGETGVMTDYEIVLKDKNGTLLNVSISAHSITGPGGMPAGIEGTLRDVTKRKRAEDRKSVV